MQVTPDRLQYNRACHLANFIGRYRYDRRRDLYRESTIGISLKLNSSGATSTIIDGGGIVRVISIYNSKAIVGLSNVTVQNGVASAGGGIRNLGTLSVTNSTLSENSAYGYFASDGRACRLA